MTKRNLLGLLLAVVCLVAVDAHAAGWEKIDDEAGIVTYKKDVPGSSFLAFKGIATIDAPIEKILFVLADNAHRTEWLDRLKTSRVLEQKSPYEYVVYQHYGAPPLVSDRDYVIFGRATQNAKGQVVLRMWSVEHAKAPETVGVRGKLHRSSYVLTPRGKKTEVIVEIHTDPMGMLPGFVVNLIQKSWARNTLTALANQVKKPHVKAIALPPKG